MSPDMTVLGEEKGRHRRRLEDGEDASYFVWWEYCIPISSSPSSGFSCNAYLRPVSNDDDYNDDTLQQLRLSTDIHSSTCTLDYDNDDMTMTCRIFSNRFGYYYATCSVAALYQQQGASAVQQACMCHNATLYQRSSRDICQKAPCNGDNDDDDCPVCEWSEQCQACQFGTNNNNNKEYNGIPVEALDWFLSTLSDNNADGSNSMDVTEYVDNTQPSIQYQNVAWEMSFSSCTADYTEEAKLTTMARGIMHWPLVVTVAAAGALVLSLTIGCYYYATQRKRLVNKTTLKAPLATNEEGVLA